MAPRVALVVDFPRVEERMILEALRERVEVEEVNLRYAALEVGGSGFDAAVVRPLSMYRALYAAAVLEASGAFTVNESKAIAVAGDKVLAYSRLASSGLPVPRSFYAATPQAALDAAGRLGYPVVLKPPVGSWGRLVSRASNPLELEQLARLRGMLPCSQLRSTIVQEYVDTRGSDVRCIVVAGSLLGCVRRAAAGGEWRSNVALGARVEALRADPEIEELAVKSAEAVGGFFVSVDIFEAGDGGYAVNEVNGVPEFKGFHKATGLNPAVSLAEELVARLKR